VAPTHTRSHSLTQPREDCWSTIVSIKLSHFDDMTVVISRYLSLDASCTRHLAFLATCRASRWRSDGWMNLHIKNPHRTKMCPAHHMPVGPLPQLLTIAPVLSCCHVPSVMLSRSCTPTVRAAAAAVFFAVQPPGPIPGRYCRTHCGSPLARSRTLHQLAGQLSVRVRGSCFPLGYRLQTGSASIQTLRH
jgi:hypothetical protein